MAYTKNTWANGDTITAAKLNNMEDGIANAGGVLICNITYTGGVMTLDKTAQEIYNALLNGTPAYIKWQYGTISDYEGHLFLAPIIRISNYMYDESIVIYASRSSRATVNSIESAGTAGIIVFKATSLVSYPVALTNTSTLGTSSTTGAITS